MDKLVKKLLIVGLFITTLVYGGFSSTLNKQKFLTPDEAFKVVVQQESDQIVTTIKMGEKIHIYRDSLKFKVKGDKEVELQVNKPQAKNSEGDMVYEGSVNINVPVEQITSKVSGDYTFSVEFQGCSDVGICYQPIVKSYTFKGKEVGVWKKISSLIHEGNTAKIAEVIKSESALFVIFIFFLLGVLVSLTPCVFPMIPILSSIIVSQAGNKETEKSKALMISLVYVVAMALTYATVGVIAGLFNVDVGAALQNPWVLIPFSMIFVILALSLFGYFELGLPSSWQSKLTKASDDAQRKGGMIGTAVMGMLSALIVGPCVTPPLAGAVLFISLSGDAVIGGMALFAMGIGMGLPLLMMGIGAGKFMPKPGGWMMRVSQVFGVMMLALAILMLSRILSDGMTMMLWSLLFVGASIYMDVFGNKEGEGAMKLIRVLAMFFLLYGASLFIGVLSGSTSMLKPFEKFTTSTTITATKTEDKSTRLGYSIARLEAEIKASTKPVVVDFGKDSCTACKELEEITFPNPDVQKALKNFTFIKINLTANSADDQALLSKYGLFGTPNIIFFDKENNYLPEKSLTGFVKPEVFVEHLRGIATF